MVDGVGAVWIFAHHKPGVPQLAVCDSGDDCGAILWVDVEEDGIDFRVGAGACRGGRDMAFFVPDVVAGKAQ